MIDTCYTSASGWTLGAPSPFPLPPNLSISPFPEILPWCFGITGRGFCWYFGRTVDHRRPAPATGCYFVSIWRISPWGWSPFCHESRLCESLGIPDVSKKSLSLPYYRAWYLKRQGLFICSLSWVDNREGTVVLLSCLSGHTTQYPCRLVSSSAFLLDWTLQISLTLYETFSGF